MPLLSVSPVVVKDIAAGDEGVVVTVGDVGVAVDKDLDDSELLNFAVADSDDCDADVVDGNVRKDNEYDDEYGVVVK